MLRTLVSELAHGPGHRYPPSKIHTLPASKDRCSSRAYRWTLYLESAARVTMEYWGSSGLGFHTSPERSSVCPGSRLAADCRPILCLLARERHLFVPSPFCRQTIWQVVEYGQANLRSARGNKAAGVTRGSITASPDPAHWPRDRRASRTRCCRGCGPGSTSCR